ncbi:tripartite tricarboxylate transporter substrate binding protein [Vineibacter terrae]|uniref:Bug family tripartite tricarboxylate transporter substrate binding protein n=1 Tax=Vineibacter terrae TaxID=2586908 RepID=UPI002E3266E9|nr:tripartite tricarboxylate transporter substrate binding protein [Vineibacter terrae]HEX2889631.1 tripartite tricarboxylate transporter substrate binding protein [Vineibacter terrae]
MARVTAAIIGAIAAAMCATVTVDARAQTSPSKPITIIVPYSPGNGLDLLAREFAAVLQEQIGAVFIVENRAGAAGVIGTTSAARAPADGHTLLFTAHPPFAIAPLALAKPPYDPLSSFLPIARVGSVPLVLITAAGSPFKTLDEMKAYVRAHPERATYASAGVGSPGHLYGEQLNDATGLKLQHVPYKETGQALTDVLSGHVLVSLVSVTAAASHIGNGSLRALAIGARERLADFPDVPPLAEALAKDGLQASVWYGFFAPAGMAAQQRDKLYAEIARAGASPRLLAFMERSKILPGLLDPSAFAESLTHDVEAARSLVESAGLKER